MVVAGGLAAGLAPLLPRVAGAAGTEPDPGLEGSDGDGAAATRDFGFLPPRPARPRSTSAPIMFPVLPDATLGKATWTDTYLAPRSGGRLHEGQDLMGKKMLKLLAVADGTIVELRHESGGNSLYLKGDDGWYYCYLHINNDDPGTDNAANQFKYAFAPGMAIGKRVLKGEHIAYLGDSGNAEATGSHCHFEIRMPNAKWYNAAAVNAKYSLDAADAGQAPRQGARQPRSPRCPTPPRSPRSRPPTSSASRPSAGWVTRVHARTSRAPSSASTRSSRACSPTTGARKITAPAIRLYLGFFLRIPDYGGLDYWIRKVRAGTSLDAAASQFAGGPEFSRATATLDNAGVRHPALPEPVRPRPRRRRPRLLDAPPRRRRQARLGHAPAVRVDRVPAQDRAQVRVIQVYVAMLKRSPGHAAATPTGPTRIAGVDTGLAAAHQEHPHRHHATPPASDRLDRVSAAPRVG